MEDSNPHSETAPTPIGGVAQETDPNLPGLSLQGLLDWTVERCHHGAAVGGYAELTAHELGFSTEHAARVRLAGELHDIGKIIVPDRILCKPGRLDPAEWALIRLHPGVGAKIIGAAGEPELAHWVLCHHERFDGRGYPHGVAGEAIPCESRILAIADSYEAMTSDRPYRVAMSHELAREELLAGAGTQFDSEVVGAFLAAVSEPAARYS